MVQRLEINNLACWLHEAGDKLVIQAHGFPSDSHGGQMELASLLAESGVSALRFDFSGCGESSGETTVSSAVKDLLTVVGWAKNKYSHISFYGSSFGACVVLFVASQVQVSSIVLASAAPDLTQGWGDVDEWRKKGYISLVYDEEFRIPYSFYEDAKSMVAYDVAKKIDCPTLLLHGEKDVEVPLDQARKLNDLIPNSKLIVLDNADHQLKINGERTKAFNLIVNWFN